MDIFNLVVLAIGVLAVSIYLAYRELTSHKKKSFQNADLALVVSPDTVLVIKVPKVIEGEHFELLAAPVAAEQMFSALHGLLKFTPGIQEHITFEIAADSEGVVFYCTLPHQLQSYVESQIYAQYPNAQITVTADYIKTDDKFPCFASIYLKHVKENYFPIRTFRDFEVDPLSALTSSIEEVSQKSKAFVQVLVRPIADGWQSTGYQYVEMVKMGTQSAGWGLKDIFKSFGEEIMAVLGNIPKRVFYTGEAYIPQRQLPARPEPERAAVLSEGQKGELESIELKLSKMGFETIIRIAVASPDEATANTHLKSLTASFKQYGTSNLNSFTASGISSFDDLSSRKFSTSDSFILSTDELASIFHLPSASVETPSISWSLAKRGEPPINLPTENCTYIGRTTFRDRQVKFGIKNDDVKSEDRCRHTYLVGKTGTGKSTIFENMIIQDMKNGNGVGVMDPHGELVEHILRNVPDNRINDVIVLDPSDAQYPVGLNLLECSNPAQKNLMASGLLSVFKKHFGQISWGPRLEYLLNNAILTLLEVPGTTMLGLTRVLADDNYRKYITHRINDPVIIDFWEKEFKAMKGNQSLSSEALSPIQNKVGRFLSSSTIRNLLGQRTSTIDLTDIMDNKKILLVNLAKGRIGEDNSNLLGSLLVARLFFTVMQRVDVPWENRTPFYLYVDEFQNFASESFAGILSEARKYRLALHLTHQYTAQIPEEMQMAIFGNVGSIIALTLGAQDAKILEPEFAPVFTENDLINLEAHHFYIKLIIDGMTSAPFSGVSIPPPTKEEWTNNTEKILNLSRQKYSRPLADVEDRIRKWVERPFDLGMAIAEEQRGKTETKIEQDTESIDNKIEGEYKIRGGTTPTG
ncbi:MAG: type IV secretion system DNA-binding domain-containing protein [Patescibacteria group bacterium]